MDSVRAIRSPRDLGDLAPTGSGEHRASPNLDTMREWIARRDPLHLGSYAHSLTILADTVDADIVAYVERHHPCGPAAFLEV